VARRLPHRRATERKPVHGGATAACVSPDDRGAVSVEHALLLLFIAVVIVVAVIAFGSAVDGLFQSGKDAIPAP
jgi:Flp pilus assembly pilin Flp